MMMPGRKYSAGSAYRYGFNGKENDNEVSGDGNQYDYGFRIYNPRIGKFLSVDPLQKNFPWLSVYQFSANSPILFVDLDGLEPKKHIHTWEHDYDWAKRDYYFDGYNNYFTLKEKDSKQRPLLVRTQLIGAFPYTNTLFQNYNYDTKEYESFIPTGFTPDYIVNLNNLKAIGDFGTNLEIAVVIAATAWNSFLREAVNQGDVNEEIRRHGTTSTKDRVMQIHRDAKLDKLVKDRVLTIAVSDVETTDGTKFRLVSINSSSHQNSKIMTAVNATLKPNEILVPNILGGDAHAEENLGEFTKRYGLTQKSTDVNRPFCKTCAETNRKNGAKTSTPTSKRDPKPRKIPKSRKVN